MINRIVKFFCSLRLTVVLLGFALILVFVGTLAQVHEGLYQAQVRYFKAWFVLKPTIGNNAWPIILPGGYLIGTMLLLNLVAAHIKRFQLTVKKFGINMIHFGLVVLLLGQLLTDVFSRESSMSLYEGKSQNYSEDFRANELSFVDVSDPRADKVVSIPESYLAKKGEITDSALPVSIRVLNYWPNADIEPAPPKEALTVPVNKGLFTNRMVLPLPDDSEAEDARAATVIEIFAKDKSLGTFLVPTKTEDLQTFSSGNTEWVMLFQFAPFMGGNFLRISPSGSMDEKDIETFTQSDLMQKGTLQSKSGAFSLRVKEYWPKCRLYVSPQANSVNPHVTEGLLADNFVTPLPVVTKSDARNMPAAVVELRDAGKSLGKFLLWTWQFRNSEPLKEQLKIGNRNYQMALQFKRYYEPFSIGLMKFSHDKYKGADIDKNFASRIRLVNPQKNEDREVVIKMNYPLRYAGTTYYQASFNEMRPDETILEVVTNPSWLTPYFACILVGLGLIVQFMSHLVGFAMKRRKK